MQMLFLMRKRRNSRGRQNLRKLKMKHEERWKISKEEILELQILWKEDSTWTLKQISLSKM